MNHITPVLPLAALLLAFPVAAVAQAPVTPTPAAPAVNAPSSKPGVPTPCAKAKQLVADHKRAMALRDERAAKDKQERETCKTAQTCKKLDRLLAAAEQGKKNDVARLARYEEDAAKACKGS